MSAFIVGGGGFNGPRNSPHVIPTVDPPKRKPDMSVLQKTNSDQVIINQFYNPTIRPCFLLLTLRIPLPNLLLLKSVIF